MTQIQLIGFNPITREQSETLNHLHPQEMLKSIRQAGRALCAAEVWNIQKKHRTMSSRRKWR